MTKNRTCKALFAAAAILLLCLPAFSATARLAPQCFQGLDPNTGALLAGGSVATYTSGTTTPQATYTDGTGTVTAANPIVLDAAGVACIWIDPSLAYKFVVKDSSGTTIRTIDGINTAAGQSFTTISASGAVTLSSTLSVSGAASFGVISTSSSALVANLNASKLESATWEIPGTIGSTTPNTGAFTTLSASGATTLSGTTALNGTTTLASGKTLAATDVDSITINSVKVSTNETVPFYLFGTMVDTHMWIAPRAGKVVSIKEIHSVVGGAACAVRPRKITDTSAPGAVAGATVKEITTAAFDCTAAINTTQTGSLSATASDYTFAAGDKISLDVSGTMTGLVGVIVMEWQPQ